MSDEAYEIPAIPDDEDGPIIIDETNSIQSTPLPDRAELRKKAEESLHELKKHCPDEYDLACPGPTDAKVREGPVPQPKETCGKGDSLPTDEQQRATPFRDALVGASVGMFVAAPLMLVLACLPTPGLGFFRSTKFCWLVAILVAIVLAGAFTGREIVGELVGGSAAYFLAFGIYGIRVGVTTGWSKWFDLLFVEPPEPAGKRLFSHENVRDLLWLTLTVIGLAVALLVSLCIIVVMLSR